MRRGPRSFAVSTDSVHTFKMAERRFCSDIVLIVRLSSSSSRETAAVVILWDGGVVDVGGESVRSMILDEGVEREPLSARSSSALSGPY